MRIRNGFDEFVCLRSNLSSGNIISAWRPDLKTGMDFRGLVWKQVRKIAFFGLKSGQDLDNRAAHSPPPSPRANNESYGDAKSGANFNLFSCHTKQPNVSFYRIQTRNKQVKTK